MVSFQTIATLEAENKVTGQTFTEGDIICLKNTREKPEIGDLLWRLVILKKLLIRIMKALNPLSFMEKTIRRAQCG